MIVLRDALMRMQREAAGCLAILVVDLDNGDVVDACGDETVDTAASVVRSLFAPRAETWTCVLTPSGAAELEELLVLSDDRAYVCRRLRDHSQRAVAVLCRGTQNLGLVIGLLHQEIA